MVVPLWLRCLLALVLVASLAAAYWGRPPRRRPRPKTWRRLGVGAGGCYVSGCVALLFDQPAIAAALIALGVETLSVAAWLGRGADDDGWDDGGGSDDDPTDRDKGGPGDGWSPEDDRLFWDYVADRGPRAPVGG